ncbi:hypothetical protein FN846DRAFT_1029659 [Sphaerosporella brunnea]|uniref:Uncharacterized protein n=1 Tax=Sphaerosporella brunnea TaxID=1250544 RepID=A0A5J5EIQ5_9PEZI|nr:hypothetical protein FN846DRAFT_1029659 [Sphaerosporella brunnea]
MSQSKLTQFNPPAFLTDFTPENAKRWSDEFVSPRMTLEADLVTQFYNEVTSDWEDRRYQANISWIAFPNNVTHQNPGSDRARWEAADQEAPTGGPRARQDEYCEWSVQRNESGKIVRIVFTCEGPEYWSHLAKWQPDTVLELYRHHNPGFDIKREDLFSNPDGSYNPHNKWNAPMDTGCIMHLVQRNNTLAAQFHLGGQSTVLRIDQNGRPIREADQLLRCSRLGGAYRNSDPHIGIQINNIAHNKAMITIADPLGLYLDNFDGNAFEAPDGHNVNDFWKWTRGTPADPAKGRQAHWVRAVFEVPADKPYVIGDLEDRDGNRIQWGGQVADHIQVRLTGQFIQEGMHSAQSYHCISDAATFGGGKDEECACDRAEGLEDPGFCCY